MARRIGPPQNPPQNLELLAYDGKLQADWEPPADDGGPEVSGYWLNYRPDTATTWNNIATTIRGTTATVGTLTNGQAYQVRVAGLNAMGFGAYTDPPVSGTPTDVQRLPGQPTGLQATPGNQRVTVSWTAPRDLGNPPLTGYSVQYQVQGATSWQTWSHTGTGTTAAITGLTSDQPYQVRVAAVNGAGTGDYAEADPIALVRVPARPPC